MRVHVLANGNAGRFRREPNSLGILQAKLRHFAHVDVSSSHSDLQQWSSKIASMPEALVIVCGGDGTYSATITALQLAFGTRPLPALLLAPFGSASTIARALGARRAGRMSVLQEVCIQFEAGKLRLRPQASLQIESAETGNLVGFIFGAGLVGRFFEEFYARGGGGYLPAAKLSARIALGSILGTSYAKGILARVPSRLRIDGQMAQSRAHSLVLSSTIRSLGLGFRVTYRGAEDVKRPHLVAFDLSPLQCGLQMPRCFLGVGMKGPNCVDRLVGEFSVEFEEPEAFVVDGDLYRSRQVTVKAGPILQLVDLQSAGE